MDTVDYTEELWKVIPFALDYAASSAGRIKRIVPTRFGRGVTIMKQAAAKHGYRKIKLFSNSIASHHSVHKCVCSAFYGERPSTEHVVDHIDADPSNNAPDNLRWVTIAENGKNQARHGKQKGEGHNNCKLNNDSVRQIREMRDSGQPVRLIAERFSLDIKHTYRIISRESWQHI